MAEIKGITIELGADTKTLKSGLAELNSTIRSVQTELRQVENGLKFDPSNTVMLQQKQELLSQAIEETKNKIEVLKTAKEKADEEMANGGEINQEQYRKLVREIEKAENQLIDLQNKSASVSESLKNDTDTLINKNEDLKKELENVNESLKFDTKNIDLLKNKQDLLKSSTETLNTIIEQESSKLSKLENEYERVAKQKGENSNEAKELKGQIDTLNNSLDTHQKELSQVVVESENLETEIKNVEESTKSAEKQFNSMQLVLANLTATVITNLVKSFKNLAVSFTETTANYEKGLAEVKAISGATAEELEKLDEKAKQLGSTTKFSATESAEAFKYMALAGWEVDDMLGAVEGALNLAAATNTDLALATDIVTDAMTGFGLAAEEAGHFVDVLAMTTTNSNTTVEEMGETFKYVASLAGTLGFSIEDTAVAIGLMANAGVKGTQAGTSLKNIMTRLAAGTGEAKSAMEKLGISITNSDGTMRDLSEILVDLRSKMSGLSEAEQVLIGKQIAGTNAMSGLLAVVNASEEDFNKLTNAVNNSAGSAEKMADVMLDTLDGNMTILKSTIEGIAISFGELLLPAVNKVLEVLQGFAEWILNLNDTQKTLLVTVPLIIGGIFGLVAAFNALTTSLATASSLMAATPFGLIALGVTGLVTAFSVLATRTKQVSKEAKEFKDEVDSLKKSQKSLKEQSEEVAKAFKEQITEIESSKGAARKLITEIENLIKMENKSEAQSLLLAKKIEQLDEILGTASTTVNELTGEIELNVDAILKQVDALEAQEKANAILETQSNILEEQAKLTEDLTNAKIGLADVELQMTDYVERYGEATAKNLINYKDLADVQKEYNQVIAEQEGLLAELEEEYQLLDEQLIENSRIIEEVNEANKKAIIDSMGVAEETAKNLLALNEDALEEVQATLEEYTSLATNMFDEISVKSAMSIEDLKSNMQYNTETMKNWSENLKIVVERGLDEGLVQQIKDAGIEYSATLDMLANSTDEDLAELNELYSVGFHTIAETVTSCATSEEVQNVGIVMVDTIADGVSQNENLNKESKAAIKSAKDIMDTTVENSNFDSTGADMMRGVASGIKNNSSLVTKAIQDVANNALKTFQSTLDIHSPSRKFIKLAEYINEGIAEGLENSAGLPSQAMKDICDMIIDSGDEISTGLIRIDEKTGEQIYDNTYSAIKEKIELFEKERESRIENLEKTLNFTKECMDEELESAEKLYDAKIALMNQEYLSKVALVDEEAAAAIQAINDELNALAELEKAEKEAEAEAKWQAKYESLQKAVEDARGDYEKYVKAKATLDEYLLEREKELLEKEREAYKNSLKEQISLITEEANAKKEALKEEQELLKEEAEELQELTIAKITGLQDILTTTEEVLEERISATAYAESEITSITEKELNDRTSAIQSSLQMTLRNLTSFKNSVAQTANECGQALLSGFKSTESEIRSYISSLQEAFSGITFGASVSSEFDGSHRTGLNYVPFDDYRAILHRGEMVLTQPEAERYRQGQTTNNSSSSTVINMNFNNVQEERTAYRMKRELKNLQRQLGI